jgi:hypothetical protein
MTVVAAGAFCAGRLSSLRRCHCPGAAEHQLRLRVGIGLRKRTLSHQVLRPG